MPRVMAALLRAVNVGGANVIAMEGLRSICEGVGLIAPRTYLQSGNVVFAVSERDSARLARRLEEAIAAGAGFRPTVVLRTVEQLREVVDRNPFSAAEPNRLLVFFFAGAPDARVEEAAAAREQARLSGDHLYVYYRDGAGRSKLTPAVIEKAAGVPATARNWNTVRKLLAEALAFESRLRGELG